MLRRLVYLAAFAFVGSLLVVAVVLPEVRLGFAILAAAISVGSWWLAQRLPARPMSSHELRAYALIAAVFGVAIAAWIPSTYPFCEGPFVRNCPIDRHIVLRLCVALVGLGVSFLLATVARTRPKSLSPVA